jgi:origin recognition complex subunit 3
MINVYDWFESFQTVLETQRMEKLSSSKTRSSTNDDDNNKEQKSRTRTRTPSSSPRKRGNNKMKKQQQPPEEEEEEELETEETLERWKIEVNARFIRALHELDYLGFIKHTKRKGKADHILRTLFDVADDGFDE